MITKSLRYAASSLRLHYVNMRRFFAIRDGEWRDVCRVNNVPTDSVKVLPDACLEVCVGRARVRLPKERLAAGLLRGFELLKQLDTQTDCEMSWDVGLGALSIRFAHATYTVEQYEELYILSELYLAGDYSLLAPDRCLMLDVGANVGFASIFLAAQNPTLKLMAFEPLARNFTRAQRNVARNDSLRSRITLFDYGLYSSDQDVTIQCDEENPGMSSVVLDRTPIAEGALSNTTVKMKNASEVVRKIADEQRGCPLWMKMDCEGSEYAILDNLIESGSIGLIDLFVLEWHGLPTGEGLREIENRFIGQGYGLYVRARNLIKQPAGIVVAFRRTRQSAGGTGDGGPPTGSEQ